MLFPRVAISAAIATRFRTIPFSRTAGIFFVTFVSISSSSSSSSRAKLVKCSLWSNSNQMADHCLPLRHPELVRRKKIRWSVPYARAIAISFLSTKKYIKKKKKKKGTDLPPPTFHLAKIFIIDIPPSLPPPLQFLPSDVVDLFKLDAGEMITKLEQVISFRNTQNGLITRRLLNFKDHDQRNLQDLKLFVSFVFGPPPLYYANSVDC